MKPSREASGQPWKVDLDVLKAATPRYTEGHLKGAFIQCLVCGEKLNHRRRPGTHRSVCENSICEDAYLMYWKRARSNRRWRAALELRPDFHRQGLEVRLSRDEHPADVGEK